MIISLLFEPFRNLSLDHFRFVCAIWHDRIHVLVLIRLMAAHKGYSQARAWRPQYTPYGELARRAGYIKNLQLGWSTRCGTPRGPTVFGEKV